MANSQKVQSAAAGGISREEGRTSINSGQKTRRDSHWKKTPDSCTFVTQLNTQNFCQADRQKSGQRIGEAWQPQKTAMKPCQCKQNVSRTLCLFYKAALAWLVPLSTGIRRFLSFRNCSFKWKWSQKAWREKSPLQIREQKSDPFLPWEKNLEQGHEKLKWCKEKKKI